MSLSRILLFAVTACGLAACASAPPSSFSNAVRTDSGINATGAAGTAGGSGAAAPGAGSVTTTPVR